MYLLNIPNTKTNYYIVNSANRTIIGTKVMEYTQDKLIEISIKEVDSSREYFQVRYKLHKHTTKGASLIHQWINDMDEIQSELFFIINNKGRLIKIDKINRLHITFEKQIDRLKRKYPEGIEKLICIFQ